MNLSKAKAIKAVRSICNIATEASLTESLIRGARMLSISYNQIRNAAIDNGWIDGELVPEFKKDEYVDEEDNWEDATIMDAIGVCAKILLVQLEDEYDELPSIVDELRKAKEKENDE